jgi:hypothetical protein
MMLLVGPERFAASGIKLAEHLQTESRRRTLDPLRATLAAVLAAAFLRQARSIKVQNGFLTYSPLSLVGGNLALIRAFNAGVATAQAQLDMEILPETVSAVNLAPLSTLSSQLDHTTQERFHQAILDHQLTGLTDAEMQSEAQALAQSWVTDRAEMIADYEVSKAYHQGMQDFVGSLGSAVSIQKRWSADPDACPICIGNEEDGWIDDEALFASGVSIAPQHPNCRCSLEYRENT